MDLLAALEALNVKDLKITTTTEITTSSQGGRAAHGNGDGLPVFSLFGLHSTDPDGLVSLVNPSNSGRDDPGTLDTDAGRSSAGITQLIVVPLSNAAGNALPHQAWSIPPGTTMDLSWWGTTGSLAFAGLLLGALAATLMKW
jgi:hypothetical protein